MFYEVAKGHGLPHDPFKACVVPRPIGWITTLDGEGRVNLAPFSFFAACSDSPPQVMFCPNGPHADGGAKDSLLNVEATGEFVANIATYDLREAVNETSRHAGRGINEAELAGLALAPSRLVRPPRVAASPVHLECRLIRVVELLSRKHELRNAAVFGEVVAVHIDDAVLRDGHVDIARLRPLSRLGYLEYGVTDSCFELPRPDSGGGRPRRAAAE